MRWIAMGCVLSLCAAACGGDDGSGDDGSSAAAPAPMPAGARTLAPGECASPGQRFSCDCPPTGRGFQTCQPDGILSECDCRANEGLDERRFGCDPADPLRLPCTCDDGRSGLRLCGDDGVVQPCDCDLPDGDGGSDDPSDQDAGT